VQPVVVDSENEVIIGHGRLKAAKKLGLDEIPVIRHDDITDSEAKALRLADNKIAESEWEDEKLAVELEQLTEADDYEDLIHGFDEDEMSEYLDSLTDEEDLEEPESEDPEQVETDIQEGEVFKLGRHRLMCGDATNEEHVEILMNGKKADLLLTDPPYGIDFQRNYREEKFEIIEGDESLEFFPNFVDLTDNFLANNSAFYCFSRFDVYPEMYKELEKKESLEVKNLLVIPSTHTSMGDLSHAFDNNFEICIYGQKGKRDFNHVKRFKRTERSGEQLEDEYRKRPPALLEGFQATEFNLDLVHPTQKTVELFAYLTKLHTNQSEKVLDLFTGSGTTLLAAEQTNRKALCMELDPQYCQVIINRWEELTGKKADPIT